MSMPVQDPVVQGDTPTLRYTAIPARVSSEYVTQWGFGLRAQQQARKRGDLVGARIGRSFFYTGASVAAFFNSQAERRGGNLRFVVADEVAE